MAGPEGANSVMNEAGGEATPHEEPPEAPHAPSWLLSRPLPPIASGGAIQGLRLRDVLQGLCEPGLHDTGGHAPLSEGPLHPVPALARVSYAAGGEPRREALVVEEVLAAEAADGRLRLVLTVSGPEQSAPHLLLSVVPTSEAPHGALVGVRARYSRSKDCIVFSISSAAMSEVDWIPWIFSLNSSGLLARRSASS
jgi:hypothetical protein